MIKKKVESTKKEVNYFKKIGIPTEKFSEKTETYVNNYNDEVIHDIGKFTKIESGFYEFIKEVHNKNHFHLLFPKLYYKPTLNNFEKEIKNTLKKMFYGFKKYIKHSKKGANLYFQIYYDQKVMNKTKGALNTIKRLKINQEKQKKYRDIATQNYEKLISITIEEDTGHVVDFIFKTSVLLFKLKNNLVYYKRIKDDELNQRLYDIHEIIEKLFEANKMYKDAYKSEKIILCEAVKEYISTLVMCDNETSSLLNSLKDEGDKYFNNFYELGKNDHKQEKLKKSMRFKRKELKIFIKKKHKEIRYNTDRIYDRPFLDFKQNADEKFKEYYEKVKDHFEGIDNGVMNAVEKYCDVKRYILKYLEQFDIPNQNA